MNLKGLDLPELQALVESLGEKRYRAEQLFRWLYQHGARDFEEMTNLPKDLRARLQESAAVSVLKTVTSQQSAKDGTVKFLFELQDGLRIESVLMFDDARTTLCVSTQAGCAIDCKFCATGRLGLLRHLSAGEIVDQVLQVQREARVQVTNVVFMGMGEPFHNYDQVLKACGLLSHDLGLNLARRHIVISTSGLVPQIRRFAEEGHRYRLAISLNATTDALRTELMPLNRKWPLSELLAAARYYTEKSRTPVTFEYVLMAGLNDSDADAERLRRLLRGLRCKVNLIPYNSTDGAFRRPSQARILAFFERLASLRAPVTIRWSKGDDIAAGCGQLAGEAQTSS